MDWLVALLCLILFPADAARSPADAAGGSPPLFCARPPDPGLDAVGDFLAKNQEPYQRALSHARVWLDETEVDPLVLRQKGIKGKKKLVELLGVYVTLWRMEALPANRKNLDERLRKVVAITSTPAYHDMNKISDLHFKQDATSYLRAAYLMDTVGLDTTYYRSQIGQVKGRLDSHMTYRGANQQMAFAVYYRHFGLQPPFPLEDGYKTGLIAQRADPYAFTKMDAYRFTHEIFVPYGYGAQLDADFFDQAELAYIRRTLDVLTPIYISRKDPDLVAELVSCMRYVQHMDSGSYVEGLTFLLGNQRPDGGWGNYERHRKRYGAYIRQGFDLHTTAVVVKALTSAFHPPWNCVDTGLSRHDFCRRATITPETTPQDKEESKR